MPHRYTLSPNGEHVAAGDPTLVVDGVDTGAPGYAPVWPGNDTILYNPGDNHGTLELARATGETRLVHPLELFELAAAGGRWAGIRAGVGLYRDVAPNDPIPGAGQPAIADDGLLIFLTDDNRALSTEDGTILARGGFLREPHCSLGLIAWWQDGEIWLHWRGGRPVRLSPMLPGEARPRCIDNPDSSSGLLTMTQTALVLRPNLEQPERGHVLELGNDRNLHSDCRPTVRGWRIVANTHDGQPFDDVIPFDRLMVDLVLLLPIPVPEPDPIPGDVMFPEQLKNGVSLRDFIASHLRASGMLGKGADEQARRDNAATAVARAAHAANQIEGQERYGLRSKHRAGWSQVALKAGGTIGVFSDLLAYRAPSGAAFSADVVTSGESPDAGTGWTNEGLIDDSRHRFVAPSELALIEAQPVPQPEPQPGTTHMYIGGGNDTDICDACGLSRFDVIHAIPESKRTHAYDPGEDGHGLCDICQQPEAALIHHGVPVPVPEPEPEPEPGTEIHLVLSELRDLRAKFDRIFR